MLIFPSLKSQIDPVHWKTRSARACVCVCVCVLWWGVCYVCVNSPPSISQFEHKTNSCYKAHCISELFKGKGGASWKKETYLTFFLKPSLFVPHYFPLLVLQPLITSESGFLKISCLLKNNLKIFFKYTYLNNHRFRKTM